MRRGAPSGSMRKMSLPPVTLGETMDWGGGAAGRCGAPATPGPPTVTVTGPDDGGGGGGWFAEAGAVCLLPTPAAQMAPSGATATAVTSRFGSWYSTKPSPAGDTRSTSPPGSVP